MGSEQDKPLSGIAILEPRFTWSGRDTAGLTYTEASPRPGSPIGSTASSQAQPSISGGQDTDCDVYVTRSGQPNITHLGNEGMNVAYRISGGTWRGWSPPGFLHSCDQIVESYSASTGWDAHACVTIPSSQKVVAVLGLQGGTTEPYTRVLDPADWTWDASVDVLADVTGYNYDDAAITIMPNERLICVFQTNDGTTNGWRMYYSDDEAATWTLGSAAPFSTAASDVRLGSEAVDTMTLARTCIIANDAGDVLFIREGSQGGTPFAKQYASNSQGAVFALVGASWTTNPPKHCSLMLLKSGAIGMVSEINGSVVFSRLASPFDTMEDVATVDIVAGVSSDSAAGWVDDDGMLYAAASVAAFVRVYYSDDEGVTWVRMDSSYPIDGEPFYSGDSGTKYLPAAACVSMGRTIMLGNSVAGGGSTYDGMVWACQMGGWSNIEHRGWIDSAGSPGQTWIPIEAPDSISTWTAAGSGSATLTTPGMLQISTTSATKTYTDTDVGSTTSRDYQFLIDIQVANGGSVTTNDCGAHVAVGDGTNVGAFLVNFTAGEYAIYDVTGTAARGTVDHGLEAGRIQVLVYHEWVSTTSRKVTTYYKSSTAELWTKGHDAVTVTTGASAAATSVIWGHSVSSSCDSDWYQFHMGWSATAGALSIADSITTLTGKALNANSYPIPTIGPDDKVARLAMLSGPGLIGESWDIDAVGDYPLSNCYPDVSPSPRATYRSTGTDSTVTITEAILASWDLGEGTRPGESMILAAFDSNVPSMILQGDNGPGWANVVTLDQTVDFVGLDYQRTGNVIKADTSGTNASRFIHRNEFAGGFVDLGSGKLRKILRNTAGEWLCGADATIPKALVYLDGIDGTEGTSADCTIYPPNSYVIVHNVTKYDKWQVKAFAGKNADGYFSVGSLFVGYIAYPGKRHGHGWSWRRDLNATTRRDAGGTSYVTEAGKAPRTLTQSWQTGVNMRKIREFDGSAATNDYLIAGSGNPVATVNDVPTFVMGLIDEVKSGELPVIALPLIDDSGGVTITDPTRMLYSRITSSAQINNVRGNEAATSGEVYRVESLTFEEIV